MSEAQVCLVCCESLVPLPSSLPASPLPLRAFVPCGHNDVCGKCHLKLRYLHNDFSCVQCKVVNDKVIVGALAGQEVFEDFTIWGDDAGPGYAYHEESKMFFPKDYFRGVVSQLFSLRCSIKSCQYVPPVIEDAMTAKGRRDGAAAGSSAADGTDPSQYNQRSPPKHVQPLLAHIKEKHGRTFCVLCYVNKRDYLALLPRYTPSELKAHLSEGDGVTSHALCEFCGVHFYDLEALHKHLNKIHYRCHLCDAQGKENQYFRDYRRIERHFERSHYLCRHRSCREARFVAFGSELDYKAHLK
eukprot:CAMPEP_0197557638 /NCGR_PEP_ID=MMETSP1320-20131121/17503_1 /TAXON_ID=91990 /ORGANISM="Bolidomonas sp., Strain RCC2347" /LENGTH=299 /DNA_ID=CAMNT_0043118889 /DNA_START=164 /DNA_END=1060 /DNA_ORIENTATION=+